MQRVRSFALITIMVAWSAACFTQAANPAVDAAYQQSFEKWKADLVEDLKENWLPLAGLFWLKPGANSFGTDAKNSIVLPEHSAPAQAGEIKEGVPHSISWMCSDVLTSVRDRGTPHPNLPLKGGGDSLLGSGRICVTRSFGSLSTATAPTSPSSAGWRRRLGRRPAPVPSHRRWLRPRPPWRSPPGRARLRGRDGY